MEAVVLAGGLGTRLRSVVSDVPKPMGLVAGRPFLDYILHYLKNNGIRRVVLAVGYKWEVIEQYYSDAEKTFGLELVYSVEDTPLGTGGAIFKAAQKITDDSFFIINGDTFFGVPLAELGSFAAKKKAEIAIALKGIKIASRYGSVERDASGRILAFKEKIPGYVGPAEINGGIYFIKKELMGRFSFPEKFSFETDFIQAGLESMRAYGKTFPSRFIDIGIPEDFYKAQNIFKNAIE